MKYSMLVVILVSSLAVALPEALPIDTNQVKQIENRQLGDLIDEWLHVQGETVEVRNLESLGQLAHNLEPILTLA
jgi:hypothetical protein